MNTDEFKDWSIGWYCLRAKPRMEMLAAQTIGTLSDVDVFLPYVTMGSELPFTAAPSTVTLTTFSMSGNSNIVFNNIFSYPELFGLEKKSLPLPNRSFPGISLLDLIQ